MFHSQHLPTLRGNPLHFLRYSTHFSTFPHNICSFSFTPPFPPAVVLSSSEWGRSLRPVPGRSGEERLWGRASLPHAIVHQHAVPPPLLRGVPGGGEGRGGRGGGSHPMFGGISEIINSRMHVNNRLCLDLHGDGCDWQKI